jgi:hypothetical protein
VADAFFLARDDSISVWMHSLFILDLLHCTRSRRDVLAGTLAALCASRSFGLAAAMRLRTNSSVSRDARIACVLPAKCDVALKGARANFMGVRGLSAWLVVLAIYSLA